MVTSTKAAEDKAVAMNADAVIVNNVPPRTLLEDVNAHLTCVLCRGYYIDATTIVECLHSFCRSCIVKHLQTKKYCPVCEMMINAAKPNIKPDKALQDIVYKLVPGLFQREMERRRQFYSSRPGPAASATPEQRGEDTERIIFSPEDVISFSLEYSEITDTESVSSRSSESGNEAPSTAQQTRRFLQCPAVVNISHLKKFISMKFDIDCTLYCIDILYKRVSLLDYYTLMDIAYIYNWKRNEPMRFFYQITDYSAIRSRFGLFDINRKNSHFRNRKQSPTNTDDANIDSPSAPNNDHSSDGTSGTDSPMPDEPGNSTSAKNATDKPAKKPEKMSKPESSQESKSDSSPEEVDVEKSQFLNSFELTAKSNSTSPVKAETSPTAPALVQPTKKGEETKTKLSVASSNTNSASTTTQPNKQSSQVQKPTPHNLSEHSKLPARPLGLQEFPLKRTYPSPQNSVSPKRKFASESPTPANASVQSSPVKSSVKSPQQKDTNQPTQKSDSPKTNVKKLPDLKLNVPSSNVNKMTKPQSPMNRGIRTDLLANNSDPITDRSKILSQVKRSLGQSTAEKHQPGGDPLKSLFDSCKINIPSSLSITLTDQKLEQRGETNSISENTKSVTKTNPQNGSGTFNNMKSPTPAVQNSIEILKLPDVETKTTRTESSSVPSTAQPTKSSEPSPTTTTAKGPIPSLKPISDTKIGKQPAFTKPSPTFHQIFIQSLQSQQQQQQQTDKTKVQKSKAPVPKLMPAIPKPNTEAVRSEQTNVNKNQTDNKTTPSVKGDNILDLSTPSQLGPHQTKLLETMQSIANLAKKQNFSPKPNIPTSISTFTHTNKPVTASSTPLRIPTQQNKQKIGNPASPSPTGPPRLEALQSNKQNFFRSAVNAGSNSPSASNQPVQRVASPAHSSPRSQPRSPSVSPKLVIAEDKHAPSISDNNQSNQISSSSTSLNKSEGASQSTAGQSKSMKITKPQPPPGTKLTNVRLPGSGAKPVPSGLPVTPGADMFHPLAPQILAQQQALQQLQARQHSDMQAMGHMHPIAADWINKINQARLENLYKSFSNVQQAQNEYNGKDNKK